jgi:sarcosine oxidase, subunit gamma
MIEPVSHSPLSSFAEAFAAVEAQSSGLLTLRECPFAAQLTLRMPPGSTAAAAAGEVIGGPLPLQPNTVVRYGEHDVLWMGPDEWLLVAPPSARVALEQTLDVAFARQHAAVVDVSAQRTIVEVGGPGAREVLARGCALDLHESIFVLGRCAQTLLARAHVILQPIMSPAAVRVFVRASFAQYLGEWLLDASLEERAPSRNFRTNAWT